MRVERLDLLAFGPFTSRTLDLSAPGLHVVSGPNEAGKSSAMAALVTLLFGFEHRSSYDFVHPLNQLRLAARVVDDAGTVLEVVRHKRNRDPLTDAEGAPLPPDVLSRLVGAGDRQRFLATHALDHDALRRGGLELCAGDGDLGEALFTAGLGGAGLSGALRSLSEDADRLFRPRGQRQRLNAAVASATAALSALAAQQVRPEDYTSAREEVRRAEEQAGSLRDRHRAVCARLRSDQTLRAALPTVVRRAGALASRSQLAERGPAADEDADRRLQDASALAGEAEARVRAAEDEVARIDGQLEHLQVPSGLLARAAEVAELYQQVRFVHIAREALPGLRAERDALRSRGQKALTGLLPGEGAPQTAERLRLSTLERSGIEGVAARYAGLEQALGSAQDEMRRREEALAAALQAKEDLPRLPDPTALRDAVEAWRRAGDVADRFAHAGAAAARAEQEVAVALAGLGLAPLPVADAERLPLPSPHAVEELAQGRARDDEALESAGRSLHEARVELVQVEEELAGFERLAALPDEAQLADQRRAREELWAAVRRSWLHPGAAGAGEPADVPAASPEELADQYAASVTAADATGDRLRREASEVARRHELRTRQARVRAVATERARRIEELRERQAGTDRDWADLWAPLPMPVPAVRDGRPVLARLTGVVAAAAACRAHAADRDRARAVLAAHRAALAQALAVAPGEDARAVGDALPDAPLDPAPDPTLDPGADVTDPGADVADPALTAAVAALAARAEHRLREHDEGRSSRERAEAARAAAGRERDAAAVRLARAEEALGQWRSQWSAAIDPLQLPLRSSGMPGVAAVLTLLQAADEALSALSSADHRQHAIDGHALLVGEFDARVAALVAACAPELAGLAPGEVAEELHRRLQQGRQDQRVRLAALEQRERHVRSGEEARGVLVAVQAETAALLERVGVADLPALHDAVERGRRMREHAREVSDCERLLLDQGGGRDLEELLSAAEQTDAVELDAAIGRLEADREAVEEQYAEAQRRLGDAQRRLAGMAGGSEAADAGTLVESSMAECAFLAEEFFSVELARRVLEQEMDRYREASQGPLLARAGGLFGRLTLGRFTGLEADLDEGQRPLLFAVRADGRRLTPRQLSEGTADQLYLALRLAALEHTGGESVPLLLDDLMVAFDDERARAALRVLSEVSSARQVLVFTHHEHLVELAGEELGDSLLVHRLERSSLSGDAPGEPATTTVVNLRRTHPGAAPWPRHPVTESGGHGAGALAGTAAGVEEREEVRAVREWARRHGYDVGERGRLSAAVLAAYAAAHRGQGLLV